MQIHPLRSPDLEIEGGQLPFVESGMDDWSHDDNISEFEGIAFGEIRVVTERVAYGVRTNPQLDAFHFPYMTDNLCGTDLAPGK